MMTDCDICGSAMAPMQGRRLRVLRCASCGYWRLDPNEWEAWRKDHHEYYAEEGTPATLDAERTFIKHRVRRAARHARPGRAAELGAGFGETAAAFARIGFSVDAIEESSVAFDRGKAAFPEVRWVQQDVSTYLKAATDSSLDLLTLYHCLEHLPRPADVCREAARVLRPGGVLVIEVPNASGRQAATLGDRWPHFVPHHLSYFNERSLRRLLEPMGFQLLEVEGKYHFSHPQGVLWKDVIKRALALAGWSDVICTYWRKK